jgi:3-hydroxyisobutyrate dehydrogenase
MARSETSAPTAETVAVLGTGGTMGFAMARNTAKAGIKVRAWNRSRDKAEPLAEHGAYIADTPAEAATGVGIVLTLPADTHAVLAAMEGNHGALPVMADRCGPGHALWLRMSTIGEQAAQRCMGLANRFGVGFVDAPVLGTRQPAEQGQLVVLESGPERPGRGSGRCSTRSATGRHAPDRRVLAPGWSWSRTAGCSPW